MTPTQKRMDAGLWWDKGPMVVKGCTVVSPGCANCWAAGMEHRFKTGNTTRGGKWSGRVQTDIGALEKAVRGKPKVIAIWNDLFHPDVPDDFIFEVIVKMVIAQQHRFLILTKRAKRMAEWFGEFQCSKPKMLNHIWLGTSVESQDQIDRLTWLMRTPAAKRFVSFEPLLGPVLTRKILLPIHDRDTWKTPAGPIGLVIIGAESGPKRRPFDLAWARDIVSHCQDAGVPVWVKQIHDEKGKVVHRLEEFPEDLRLREWPE